MIIKTIFVDTQKCLKINNIRRKEIKLKSDITENV